MNNLTVLSILLLFIGYYTVVDTGRSSITAVKQVTGIHFSFAQNGKNSLFIQDVIALRISLNPRRGPALRYNRLKVGLL